jgi:hypothetical protein
LLEHVVWPMDHDRRDNRQVTQMAPTGT